MASGSVELRFKIKGDGLHVCPLDPITDDEATLTLVEIMRTAGSAHEIVERLGVRGLAVGRKPG